jgi:hypothetical protein
MSGFTSCDGRDQLLRLLRSRSAAMIAPTWMSAISSVAIAMTAEEDVGPVVGHRASPPPVPDPGRRAASRLLVRLAAAIDRGRDGVRCRVANSRA